MNDQLNDLLNKKNLISLLTLAILVLAIPLGVKLVQQQQLLKSNAAGAAITFMAPNVESRLGLNGTPVLVALDTNVGVQIKGPDGWLISSSSATPNPISTIGPSSSSSPTSTPVPTPARTTTPTPAPGIVITSPSNNATLAKNKSTTINVQLNGISGVGRVELFVNGKSNTDNSKAPYDLKWKVGNGGSFSLVVKAWSSGKAKNAVLLGTSPAINVTAN